jgi:hypothetical protein
MPKTLAAEARSQYATPRELVCGQAFFAAGEFGASPIFWLSALRGVFSNTAVFDFSGAVLL